MLLTLPLWVYISFLLAQAIIGGILQVLVSLNFPISSFNETILTTVLAAVIYITTLIVVIGLPWLIIKRRTSRTELGLSRSLIWSDIIMAPIGLVVYFILSSFLAFMAVSLLPWFDGNQVQDTGFNQLSQNYEYLLAFVTLVVIAPIAEEALFRGYLLGNLIKFVPVWVAILVTSLLFGFIHGAWNLAIDTFALSIVLCLLRLRTNSLWAPILLHMSKNGIAFYLLFINPMFLHTLGV